MKFTIYFYLQDITQEFIYKIKIQPAMQACHLGKIIFFNNFTYMEENMYYMYYVLCIFLSHVYLTFFYVTFSNKE